VTGKWAQARKALVEGKVVFLPRTTSRQAYSIFSYERRKGLRIRVTQATYMECPGMAVWAVE